MDDATLPSILMSSSSLYSVSSNARRSAGIGRGDGLMLSKSKEDGGRGGGCEAAIILRGGPGASGLGGVLKCSGSGVLVRSVLVARVIAIGRRSPLDKVRWGFITCLFSNIAARDPSFGERIYASQMSVQK